MKKLDILKTAFDGYKKDIISKLYDFVDSLPFKCIQLNSKPWYRIMYNRTYEKGKVWIPPNDSFCDWAGQIYMDSQTQSKDAGQYFTPYPVSRMMAMVTLSGYGIKRRIEEDADTVIAINEPTCGAGGIIVAEIETLYKQGINYAWNVFVDCGDIDSRCVHMTYLTLSLLGVPAVVRLGDALAMEYRETWFTPAYILASPHFNKRLSRGSYPNTPTVEDKQIIAPPPQKVVEPVADKTGQYVINFF